MGPAQGEVKVARSVGHGIILVLFCYLLINLSQFVAWFGYHSASSDVGLCPVNLNSYLFYESISSAFLALVSIGIFATAMAVNSGLNGGLATFFMSVAVCCGTMRLLWNALACYWIDNYPSQCRNSPIYKMALASVIFFFVINFPVILFHGRLISEKFIGFLHARLASPESQLKSGINLKSLVNSPTYSDVIFEVESVRFFGHKSILSARCEYFAKLLYGGLRESTQSEISIQDVSAKAFGQILEFIYTGDIPNLDIKRLDEIIELMRCTDLFSYNPLKDFLEKWLEPNLTSGNIVAIMLSAHKYNYGTEKLAIAKMSQWKMKLKECDTTQLQEVPDLLMRVVEVKV